MNLFFSYGHDANVPIVVRLQKDLEKRGHEVYIDRRFIKSGDDWRRRITECLLKSDTALSFASKYSVRDPGVCLDELSIAVGVKGALVQSVLLEAGVEPPKSVLFRQTVDMSDWISHVSNEAFLSWYEDWSRRLGEAQGKDRSSIFEEYDPEAQPYQMLGDETFDTWYEPLLAKVVDIVCDPRVATHAREIEELRSILAPDELHRKRQKLERSAYAGRAWLRRQLDEWMDEADAPQVLLITGAPGVGKSSFVAHELIFDARVAAAVYCEWNNPASNSPDRVSHSIAYQLACRYPDYRTLLLQILNKERAQEGSLSHSLVGSAFERYVVEPLLQAIKGSRSPIIILIDGIDELEHPGMRNDDAGGLAALLREAMSLLPRWVRFVVTSRRGARAIDRLMTARRIDIDESGTDNTRDVREFVAARLGVRTDDDAVDRVVNACGGVFLHASMLCEAIACGVMSVEDAESLPKDLGEAYHQNFRRMFADAEGGGYSGSGLAGCEEAVCALAVSKEPVPLRTLRFAARWRDPDLSAFLDRCAHFVSVRDEEVTFNHKSLVDWLLDGSAREYQADRGTGWIALARACFTQFENGIEEMNDYELLNLVGCVRSAQKSFPFGTSEREECVSMLDELQESDELADVLLEHGEAGLKTRRYDLAESCAEDAADIYHHILRGNGGYAQEYVRCLMLQAEALDLSVRLERAVAFCDKGIKELSRLKRRKSIDVSEAQRGIAQLETKRAYVLFRIGGRSDEAEEGFERAANMFAEVGDEKGVAESLVRLGLLYRNNGQPARAVACSERIESLVNLAGLKASDPSFYCFVRIYQGDFHLSAEMQVEARQFLTEAQELMKKPSTRLPKALEAQLNLQLSYACYRCGDYEGATPYAREALRLEREVYGNRSVESCNGLNQLGFCLLRTGDVPGTVACFERSYAIRSERLGEQNHLTTVSLRNCALAMMEVGDELLPEAKEKFEKVLEVRLGIYTDPSKAPRVAETHLDLCNVSLRMGQAEDALMHATEAEAIYRDTAEESGTAASRNLATCLASKAEALIELGRKDEARACLDEAGAFCDEVFGVGSEHAYARRVRELESRLR